MMSTVLIKSSASWEVRAHQLPEKHGEWRGHAKQAQRDDFLDASDGESLSAGHPQPSNAVDH